MNAEPLTATGAQKTTHSCEHCHRRKVRCDVNRFGSPCTNCRLDGRPCEKRAPLKRGRKSRLEKHARQTASSTDSGPVNGNPVNQTAPKSSAKAAFQVAAESAEPTRDRGLPHQASLSSIPFDAQVLVPFYYHGYLQRADIRHLAPAQVSLLEDQGCLKVPSGPVLHEFIRHYFLYVHPCLPILDEGSFWSLYSGDAYEQPPGRGISLALFQAILFAASRFLKPEVITACGFENLKHARTLFHRRAELLLLHEVERDTLTLGQTSLLLSLQSTIKDQTLNSAWLTRAIDYARLVKADHYYECDDSAAGDFIAKKKLWWCCILRDRMIAIGVRRRIQITPDNFNFEQRGLEQADFAQERNTSQVYSADTKLMLTRVIIAQCELAVAQTPTMLAAYQQADQDITSGSPTIAQLLSSTAEVERAKTELAIWSRRFKAALIAYADTARKASDTRSSITLFADMALIHYFSTLVALSNHQVSVLERHQVHIEDYSSRLTDLNTQLRSSIANVADRVKRLSDQGLAHHLPISAPACTALPFVLEALNLRLSTSSRKSMHQKQLDYYTKIMKMFRAQHDHTECVTTAVDSILTVLDPEISHLLTAPDTPQSVSTTQSHNSLTAVTRPATWSDMLANSPLIYLRLSLFLDLALSRGKAPHVTDLPIWTLGAAATLQAPAISSSLHLMMPSMPQNMLPYNDQSRFVELGDNDDMSSQWPVFDQTESLDYPASWSFADMDMVGAWFDSV